MKTFKLPVAVAALAACLLLFVGVAVAGDTEYTGKIACAHCTLHAADAKGCQDVLVVSDKGATTQYYIVKNEVSEKFGHTCKGEKAAKVAGTVTEKDGKKWITPTTMEEKKS